MQKPEKWKMEKALCWGFVIGAVYIVALAFLGEDMGDTWDALLASTLGGAIGGAALFGVVAMIRNFFVK